MPAVEIGHRPARAFALAPVLPAAQSDILSGGAGMGIITQYVGGQTIAYMIGALAGLALLLVVAALLSKFKVGKGRDAHIAMTMDDVGAMKAKGLLSDDEARLVKSALGRQVLGQMAEKKPVKGSASLVLDPEVQELERIAAEKAAARQRREESRDSAWAGNLPRFSDDSLPSEPDDPDFFGGNVRPPTSATNSAVPRASSVQAGGVQDVELPPEVVRMLQQGLITAEEAENIRQRLRARG